MHEDITRCQTPPTCTQGCLPGQPWWCSMRSSHDATLHAISWLNARRCCHLGHGSVMREDTTRCRPPPTCTQGCLPGPVPGGAMRALFWGITLGRSPQNAAPRL
eukprot:1159132-Pelagomonas_calceolata.AAC.2